MSLGEIYGFVVYTCGIDPLYFLDEMSQNEVGYLADAWYKEHKERWEMLRLQNHAVISAQSTKPVKPTDIMSFAWDESTNKIKKNNEDSRAARDRIKRRFNINK